MRISSKADCAVRAALELAAAAGEPLSAETISQRQGIPAPFLKKILSDLQRGNVVMSQRGSDGGHRLARSANEITIADVLRAVEGPLANVRGRPPRRPCTKVGVQAPGRLDRVAHERARGPRTGHARRSRRGPPASADRHAREPSGLLAHPLSGRRAWTSDGIQNLRRTGNRRADRRGKIPGNLQIVHHVRCVQIPGRAGRLDA